MLIVANDKKVEDFEKYGFKVLVTDEELEKRTETDPVELYCTMAYIPLGNHFNLIIENDEFCRQLTIVPDDSMSLKFCLITKLVKNVELKEIFMKVFLANIKKNGYK